MTSGKKGGLKSNGQACYWFSNGCTIGCDECDGKHNHIGHGNQRFLYKGMSRADMKKNNVTMPNPWVPNPGEMTLDPKTMKSIDPHSNCAAPTTNATICDPRLRTLNTEAECGSKLDFYQFSPWRAPGSAPVIDACGSAGGTIPGEGNEGNGASFENSTVAKQGDRGSKLSAMPSQATWKAGTNVEAGWTIMAHHGGGYAYRLAPADAPLTEDEFRKMPLDFVGNSILRWDHNKSTQLEFNTTELGWETNKGTVPEGSM
jgi:hypothetical protein